MNPKLISVQKIWNFAKHNGFTDLFYHNHLFFCSFRESNSHERDNPGKIRIISSQDTKNWQSHTLFSKLELDLRDPKLTLLPNGKLMLYFLGAKNFKSKENVLRQMYALLSDDGKTWKDLIPILPENEWLWRLTWRNDIAYGFSYRIQWERKKPLFFFSLFSTQNGIDYTCIQTFDIPGYPNEATIRFLPDGTMIALVRRDKKQDRKALLGTSSYPYKNWNWQELDFHIGAPNFLLLRDFYGFASGRLLNFTPYGLFASCSFFEMKKKTLTPLFLFPSAKDCSYPGMVYCKKENSLFVSYYSSHEKKKNTAIYLAKIIFDENEKRKI